MAIEVARARWGVELADKRTTHPTLPFMSETGCVVAPHLRPLCTLHTCDINAVGLKVHPKVDAKWDRRYWRLREQIERLELAYDDRSGKTVS